MIIDYEPGNGTRYRLLFDTLSKDRYLFCWFKNADVGGLCYLGRNSNHLHLNYLMEKMTVNKADGLALLKFLKEHGVNVLYPPYARNYFERYGWEWEE
tara:strand:- start:1261 stop:1554 length:294 start_codon:yes stop_codon:yes gene_type:complete